MCRLGTSECIPPYPLFLFYGDSTGQYSWESLLTRFVRYHTKTLTLGLVSGPVEGIVTLCIVYAVTAVKGGASYWQQSMLLTLGVPKLDFLPDTMYAMDFGDFYMTYGALVLVFNTYERYLNSPRQLHSSTILTILTAPRTSSKPAAIAARTPITPSSDCSPSSAPGS